jgi:tetratricopeptide (TPR) repeat protein
VAIVLFPGLVLCGRAASGEPPDPRDRAEEVRAADVSGDAERLRELAAEDNPDPWLVAHALLAEGATDLALRFARAARREDVKTLPDYVAGHVPPDGDADRQAALRAAVAAIDAGDGGEALRSVSGLAHEPPDVTTIRILTARGRAHFLERQWRESAAAHARAAAQAEGLGWWTRASEAHYLRSLALFYANAHEEAVGAHRRRLEIETLLDSEQGIGRAHLGLFTTHASLLEGEAALRHLDLAEAAAEAADDFEYVSKALASRARIRAQARTVEAVREALGLMRQAMDALDRVVEGAGAARFEPDTARIASDRVLLRTDSASWQFALGEEREARALLAEAIEKAAASGNETLRHRTSAQVLATRGDWDMRHDDHEAALASYEEAQTHYEAVNDDLMAAALRRRRGVIHGLRLEYREALALHEEAVDILRDLGAGAERQLATALTEAGNISTILGHFGPSLSYLEEARELVRRLEDRQLEANVLGMLGEHFEARNQLGPAVGYLEEALAVQAQAPTRGERGALLATLARIYLKMDNPERALPAADAALEELLGDPRRALRAKAGQTRADVLVRMERFEDAYAAFEASIEGTTVEEDRATHVAARMGMGEVRFLQGRYEEALEHHRQALALLATAELSPLAVLARSRVGRDLYFAGWPAEAVEELEKAHDEARTLGVPEVTVRCLFNLAETHLDLERYEAAMAWTTQALDEIAIFGLDLAEGEGAVARSGFASLPAFGAEAAWKANDLDALFTFVERGRAATLVAELGGRRSVREATVPEHLLEREAAARAALGLASERFQEARDGGLIDEIRSRRTEMEAAAARLREVVDSIRRSERGAAAPTGRDPVSLADAQRRMGSGDAFVLYAPVREGVVALVLTAGEVRAEEIGSADEVADVVDGLLREGKPYVEPDGIAAARARLIDPLVLPADARRVFISPTGSLAYVPFALLVPGRDLAVVPSATTLDLLEETAGERGRRFLVLGNPDYTERPDPTHLPPSLALLSESLDALVASEAEARMIGARTPSTVLTGRDASESRLRREVPTEARWRAIHFACHGLIDPEHPKWSALALTADAENDGFLTALDVFRLRMPADLVTLSGCETGKGRVVRGEGVVGLTGAFLFAGAPRVVVSLWEVDDDATSALMQQFYDLWHPADGTRGLPAATALRWAQDYVRHQPQWSHPRYWAAWVLWGLPD